MLYQSVQQLHRDLEGVLESSDGRVAKVIDPARLRAEGIDSLIYTAVFGEAEELREQARNVIRDSALQLGIRPCSTGSKFGALAVDTLAEGKSGFMVGELDGKICLTPLEQAFNGRRQADQSLLELARRLTR